MSLRIQKNSVSSTSSQGVADCLRPEEESKKEYVLVERPVLKRALSEAVLPNGPSAGAAESDKKLQTTETPALLRDAHYLSRRGMKKGMRLRVWLWSKILQNQSTTALTTVSALQPGSTPDWSSFTNLYDDARCHGVTIHARHTDGSNTNGNNTAVSVFDPGVAGSLNSVLNGLEHTYHVGPVVVPNIGSSPAMMGGATPTGFHVFKGKTVKVLESGLVSDLVGGNWFPTSGTNAIVGYLKPYVENAAAGTVYCVHFVGYDMEFRCRS